MSSAEKPGRGTMLEPANRFESMRLELDPDLEPDVDPDGEPVEKRPATIFYRDASRSILAKNSSPDVGFTWSVNPYRGCEHGCSYCVAPETPILHGDMTWRPIGEARVGDELLAFDEFPEPGGTRKFRAAVVEHVWWSRRPTRRLVTDHQDVVTTDGHRWLQHRAFRWSSTEQLAGRSLRHLAVVSEQPEDDDYRIGYLSGLTLGDGTFRYQPGWRNHRLGFPQSYWRIALVDDEPLVRILSLLRRFGVEGHIRPFSAAQPRRKPLRKVEIRSLGARRILHGLIQTEPATPSYRRGFLAGFFDAEGHSGDVLRISQADLSVLERVRRYAASFGFQFRLEPGGARASSIRLAGRLVDRIRFFAVCRPAIRRKLAAVCGREMNLDPEPVRAIEPGGARDVVDIQTSTGTFFAAGLATHNCYARPSHETLGWNAGLDFERRILVKNDAPELLRKELSAPRWQPEVIALSGNTDCYQPVERRLGITRRCVEVLAEFRNPVSAITKSALVARDADLFAELARDGAAHVMVSVTTLDAHLARLMEPRASAPERRLDAVSKLTAAGVPVGVMIGPVVPGLNDEEIPRILAAAGEAGAQSASWVLLRLARPLDEIFVAWLEERVPERKQRVLSRIRATRDGRLSDTMFGRRMRGQGEYAAQIAALFAASARKHGLDRRLPPLDASHFRVPPKAGDQLSLL
ncbi:MAG TPA: PA0069 family radical SAM protein [Candidatus Binatia bacterium]|nr:PA0069 family radical SAM protein [Candidatus Binatia bacterium]